MAFNVNRFRSQMTGDGARPNLFQCDISFPPSIQNIGINEKFSFMARAAQLPGSTVNSVPVMYFGRELKFSGNRSFPDWTVTIINDEDFQLRDTFERWMSGLNSHISNLRRDEFASPLGYQAGASVTQFAKTGDPLKFYDFVGIFPVDITPIELDWGSNDTIEEYSVTFAYQWWEAVAGINGSTTEGPSVA
jgi:hypothetical protein